MQLEQEQARAAEGPHQKADSEPGGPRPLPRLLGLQASGPLCYSCQLSPLPPLLKYLQWLPRTPRQIIPEPRLFSGPTSFRSSSSSTYPSAPGPWHLLTAPLGMRQTLFLPQGSSPMSLL